MTLLAMDTTAARMGSTVVQRKGGFGVMSATVGHVIAGKKVARL
jgi:hypothetical protein